MENANIHSQRKKKTKGKLGLKQAFESATSADEMLKVFKKMESKFQEKELGLECFSLAHTLKKENQDPQKILSFGKRALKICIDLHENATTSSTTNSFRVTFTNDNYTHASTSLFLATVLHLIGFACFELKRYDESLIYLNWSNRSFTDLEKEDTPCPAHIVLPSLLATHYQLFRVKLVLGRKEEVVVHITKVLEIKEKMMEEGSIELGKANHDVCDAYLGVMNFEEALPFGLKALEIYMKHAGDDSVDLALVRMNLGNIYGTLGEHDKALELTRLSLSALKSTNCSTLWISAELDIASNLIASGRNEEGIEAIESLLSHKESKGMHQVRGCAFTTMARACSNLSKFPDAKKYMKIAQRIFEKNEMAPVVVATAFEDMSRVYEAMKEYELAISYLRRAMAIPELPQKHLVDDTSRIFRLICLTGNYIKGIPYLEEVVEKLKEKFGPEHCHVGHGYNNLGVSYMRLRKPETAAKYFVLSRDILDLSLGPDHLDSLATSQTLSITYATMNSYKEAVEVQERVVECLERVGPSQQTFLDAAVRVLKDMKKRAIGEDLPELISKCGVSDDGKVI